MRFTHKRFNWKKCILLAVTSLTQSMFAVPVLAGVVIWQPVQAITGDTDVDTTGSLVYAYNFGPDAGVNQVQTVTVQGVAFTAFGAPPFPVDNVNSITQGDVTLSETPGVLNGFDTSAGTGSFASLSNAYRGLLGTAIAPSLFATMTLTLGGLESGKSYRFQIWVNDSQYDINLYNRVQADGGGNTTEIKANMADAVGGLGQYAIGLFTATSSSQEISFVGLTDIDGIVQATKNPIVNAFQLRMESGGEIPEPASFAIFGLGALGIAYRAQRRSRCTSTHRNTPIHS